MVTGTAPLSYQWKMGGTDITNATNAALVLNNVQAADAGSYTVVVQQRHRFARDQRCGGCSR